MNTILIEIKAWLVIIKGLLQGKSLQKIAAEENARAANIRAAMNSDKSGKPL